MSTYEELSSNAICFDLFENGYVNRWLVSDIRSNPMQFEKVTLNGEINLWLKEGFSVHENPCKTEFVKQKRAEKVNLPKLAECFDGGYIVTKEYNYQLATTFPWDDLGLDCSCCKNSPTELEAWASVVLWADQDEEASFTFSVCGGLHCWCNDVLCAELLPYTRNIYSDFVVTIPLKKGANTLLVRMNDLAERDAVFGLKLRYHGTSQLKQCVMLAKGASPQAIIALEEMLSSLSFTRNHFTHGNVTLTYDKPIAEDVVISYRCASEENEESDLYYEGNVLALANNNQLSLATVEEFPFGYLRFWFTATTQGVKITRLLAAEIHAEDLIPKPATDITVRKQQALQFLAKYGEENTNRALAILHSSPNEKLLSEAHQLISMQLKKINARFDCSDFYLLYFPHIIKEFSNTSLLPTSLAEEMKACLLGFRYWMDEPGDDVMWFFSENHALLFHTCALLAGELYPNEVFTNSLLSGKQLADKAAKLLHTWFDGFFKEGFTEWNSSAYLPIDMLGFASIATFSTHQELRLKAKEGMDFVCRLLAQHSLNGILASSAGRTYPKEQFGNWSNCTSAMSYICFGQGTLSHAGKGIVSLCLSDYEPPVDLASWLLPKSNEFLKIYSLHGYMNHVSLYTFKTANYLMTAAIDYRAGNAGYQENPFQLAFSATAQVFISHPGERAVFGCGRPSYWAGNGILPQVHAVDHTAVILYDIPVSHEVDFTHVYFPTMEFDEWREEKGMLLARQGEGYVAVLCSLPLIQTRTGPNSAREWIAYGRNVAWIVKAACKHEFESFDDFCRMMAKTKLETTLQNEGGLTVRIEDASSGYLQDSFGGVLTQEGNIVSFLKCNQYGDVHQGVLQQVSPVRK